jgi:chromosome segregation ATPase
MKLDIKSILIIVLLGFTLIFGYKWYFDTNNSVYKKELKELRDSNKVLQDQRDSINYKLEVLELDLLNLIKNEDVLNSKIELLSIEIEAAKANANKSKAELNKLKKELIETRRKIDNLKQNPPNRTGEDLINSLKNNLK